jgi:tetratricopeptide (TPR) repeat protein
MKISLSVFLFLISTICFSQNKLAGYVTEQNSGKKPLADVVIASAGANKIVSKDNGKFILTFQGLEAGENVVIRPEKQGWELVNEKEMKTFIPAKPDESPLKIILCKAGTLAAAKKEYYKVADPYIQQQYELKLKALNKEKTDYQSEKNRLREEKDRLQKQLDEMAEEFIRVNLDDANEVERKAIKLFKEGKIDESIQLRESLKSGIEYKNAVARKAKEDSIITFHIGNLRKLANDYLLQFDFKKAEETYQELADGDTTNFENTSEFAYFLQQQNQYKIPKLFWVIAMPGS